MLCPVFASPSPRGHCFFVGHSLSLSRISTLLCIYLVLFIHRRRRRRRRHRSRFDSTNVHLSIHTASFSHWNGWNTGNQTASRSRADNGGNHFRWMFNYCHYTLTSHCIAINCHIRLNRRSVFIEIRLHSDCCFQNLLGAEKMEFTPSKFIRMSAEQSPSIIVTTLRHISHRFNGSWHLSIRRLRL